MAACLLAPRASIAYSKEAILMLHLEAVRFLVVACSRRKKKCKVCPSNLQKLRQEKRAQRLSFWARRPPGGVGVFHAKG